MVTGGGGCEQIKSLKRRPGMEPFRYPYPHLSKCYPLSQVDLSVVRNQWVESGEVFDQIYDAAELYGIFDHLFQHAHFWPCLMLQVDWLQEDGETLVPVHRGNLVKPGECTKAPEVSCLSVFRLR